MSDVPGMAAPVCYRHPRRETYVRCTRCGRPICPDCMHVAAVGHQCPDCVAEGRRTQRTARTAFGGSYAGRNGYVTKALVGINVLMLLLTALTAGGSGLMSALLPGRTTAPLHLWLDMLPQPSTALVGQQVILFHGVSGGDWYRLLTSMFMHYGIIHLGLNMWALWVVGRLLETALGPVRYLVLYLVSGLGGSIAVYLFGAQHGLSAGASGAIFGLFAALFIVLRKVGGSARPVMYVIIANLVFTFAVPGISIAAHIGGLITGAAVSAGLAYAPRRARVPVQAVVVVAALILLSVAALVHTSMIA